MARKKNEVKLSDRLRRSREVSKARTPFDKLFETKWEELVVRFDHTRGKYIVLTAS